MEFAMYLERLICWQVVSCAAQVCVRRSEGILRVAPACERKDSRLHEYLRTANDFSHSHLSPSIKCHSAATLEYEKQHVVNWLGQSD
jgi:hypothetical protein